jgi:hypothetical protein
VPALRVLELRGSQTPRFQLEPPSVDNASAEVVELCDQVGMPLDEWQANACRLMLGERADGSWAAFEFGLIVPRQNGKGGVLEARELGGLFLFGEKHIIHSAHEEGTAAEAFMRMKNIIDGRDWLSKRVRRMSASPGRQVIELLSGQRLTYRTRTAGGGRGFSAPTVILDEAQNLNARQIAALMPLVSAQPNPQLIYAGTVMAGARVFQGLVKRGRERIGVRLGYAEWSADDDAESGDPEAWAQANPALGIRVSLDYLQAEHESFVAAGAEAEFRQERLSIWPPDDLLGSVIPTELWDAGLDPEAVMPGGVPVFGIAVSPGRDWASVGVAGRRADGSTYVELVKHEAGTDWLLPFVVGLAARVSPECFVIDQAGPAATMLAAFISAGLMVRVTDTTAYKAACAQFVDAVKYGRVVHRGQQPLTDAAYGVKEHRVGDSWVYARRDSGVIVSPLEAVTLAVWGLTPDPSKKAFFVQSLEGLLDD